MISQSQVIALECNGWVLRNISPGLWKTLKKYRSLTREGIATLESGRWELSFLRETKVCSLLPLFPGFHVVMPEKASLICRCSSFHFVNVRNLSVFSQIFLESPNPVLPIFFSLKVIKPLPPPTQSTS